MEETTNKPKKSKRNAFLTPIIFCCFVPVLLYVNGITASNIQSIGIETLVILAIMIICLFKDASSSRTKLIRVTDDLLAYVNGENLEEGFVKDCISKHRDTEASYKTQGRTIVCDIADYINEQTIADYVHKEKSDQVANVMTGLGIFGTFLGLTIGLGKFNVQDAADSTFVLLEGIKVAFYTSVFGVFASLLYGHFYHNELDRNANALESFYSVYYRDAAIPSEIKFYNEMVKNAQEQNVNIKKMAGAIGDEMVKKFDYAIQRSINKYILEAVNSQSESLKQIVEAFMRQLNESLDDQFHNLSRSIHEMCSWQDESTKNLRSMMGSLNKISEDLSNLTVATRAADDSRKEVNEGTQGMIDKARRYADAFKDYTDYLTSWTEELKTHTGKDDITRQLSTFVEGRSEEQKQLIERFDSMLEKIEAYKQQMEDLVKSHKEESQQLLKETQNLVSGIKTENKANQDEYQKHAKTISAAVEQIADVQKTSSQQLLGRIEALINRNRVYKKDNMFKRFAKKLRPNRKSKKENE